MKKLFTLLVPILFTLVVFAQSPEKMSYQAVIRDAGNALVINHAVGMRICILQGSAGGTVVYTETQTPTTNANGLVTIEIGGGTGFDAIDWSNGPYFIKTETDPTGGTNYTAIVGTSQLLSVPYALHAKTSETSTDAVKITGDQTIAGNKTFSGTTTVITPVNATDAVNKAYVDALIEQLYAQGVLRVRDFDGNYYNTIKIGNQILMAENLKTTKYLNGDLIGTTTPATLDISGESTPKYQWAYDGNESNVATYGRLYTWYAVNDSRNVCPAGWHIPSDAEWAILIDYLTNNGYGYEGSGSDIAKSMASTSGWIAYPTAGTVGNDQTSNNSSGFTALPCGDRIGNQGAFVTIGYTSFWWSSTESSITYAYVRDMNYASSAVNRTNYNKYHGFSVRCLRD